MTVEDKIKVNVPVKKAFVFFIYDISKWWSKEDEIEKEKDGKIVLFWSNGSKLESSFSIYEEIKK